MMCLLRQACEEPEGTALLGAAQTRPAPQVEGHEGRRDALAHGLPQRVRGLLRKQVALPLALSCSQTQPAIKANIPMASVAPSMHDKSAAHLLVLLGANRGQGLLNGSGPLMIQYLLKDEGIGDDQRLDEHKS